MATPSLQPRGLSMMGVPLRRRRDTGLTLVSALAAMVTLSLLMGLVGVAVWTARGAAERTACTMHLRQLANALIMYRAECGDYPPGTYEVLDSDGELDVVTWEEAVSPFLGKQRGLLTCPAGASLAAKGRTANPGYEYARNRYPGGAHGRPLRLRVGPIRIDPDDAAKAGALLACLHHGNPSSDGKRWTLVAYDDGSVKWEPSPSFVKPRLSAPRGPLEPRYR